MKREIPDNIIEQATACEKLHSCLICPPEKLCKIKYPVDADETHFIECAQDSGCNYLETCGDTELTICNCPVRKAIYQLYGE